MARGEPRRWTPTALGVASPAPGRTWPRATDRPAPGSGHRGAPQAGAPLPIRPNDRLGTPVASRTGEGFEAAGDRRRTPPAARDELPMPDRHHPTTPRSTTQSRESNGHRPRPDQRSAPDQDRDEAADRPGPRRDEDHPASPGSGRHHDVSTCHRGPEPDAAPATERIHRPLPFPNRSSIANPVGSRPVSRREDG